MNTTRSYIIYSLLIFGITFYLASNFYLNRSFKKSFLETCNLVQRKIYLSDAEIHNWHKNCLSYANEFSYLDSKEDLIVGLNFLFSLLNVSHLSVNTPVEEKALWDGLKWESGLTLVNIENYYYIVDFVSHSNAPYGPKFGDKIISLNGKTNPNWHDLKYGSGLLHVKRGNEFVSYQLLSHELKIDMAPHIKEINSDTALLRIGSFRAHYFKKQGWLEIVKKLKPYSNIIIDIRRNLGGNFTAMLRGLSPFLCSSKKIGTVGKNTKISSPIEFPDNLDDQYQYKILQSHKSLDLKTFAGYDCLHQANIKVLIDNETGSVSEIFAQAIKQTQRGKLIGQVTRGHALLAVWYDLPVVRGGYTLTIPEANFYDLENKSLEATGVAPHFHVEFEKEDLESGIDSYIKTALTSQEEGHQSIKIDSPGRTQGHL